MAGETINQKSGGAGKIILSIVIVIAIVWAAYYFVFKGKSVNSDVVDSSKFQAVFLSNGQVYFGKVSGEKGDYVSLASVYYMVLKKPLQDQNKDDQEQVKPEYTLVKLGKEMHGPTSMSINRDQILFIENLSDDSKVVSAIKSEK